MKPDQRGPSHHTQCGFVLQATKKEGGQGPMVAGSPSLSSSGSANTKPQPRPVSPVSSNIQVPPSVPSVPPPGQPALRNGPQKGFCLMLTCSFSIAAGSSPSWSQASYLPPPTLLNHPRIRTPTTTPSPSSLISKHTQGLHP